MTKADVLGEHTRPFCKCSMDVLTPFYVPGTILGHGAITKNEPHKMLVLTVLPF